jgi:hypothetical protein
MFNQEQQDLERSGPITIHVSYRIVLYRILFVWTNEIAPKKRIETYRSYSTEPITETLRHLFDFIRNFWVSGLNPTSGVWRNTTFRKLDLFPYSGKRGWGKKTPTHLGPLERANLNHWTTAVWFTQLFKYLRPRLQWLGRQRKGSSRLSEEQKPLGSVYIPYVKGVSEKFRRIGNRYSIRTIFKTKHTLRSSLMKTRPERDPL